MIKYFFVINLLITFNLFSQNWDNFKFFDYNRDKSFNLISYKDSSFYFYANPILGISFENLFDHKQRTTTWGFNIKGIMKNGLSFGLLFNDNIVYNQDFYNRIPFIKEQGRVLTVNKPKRSEFSETRGYLKYQNSWLNIGVIKDNLSYGEGSNSKLILSTKSPSFPALFYEIKFSDWFKVYMLHGWLLSGIMDSTKSYQTQTFFRKVEHEKYFALHSFEFNFFKRLILRFGETIIYSDRGPYIGYMLPFLFYRSIDHMFTYGSEDSGNNGSFFFDGSYQFSDQHKIYGSLFIDELSFSNLLKGKTDRNQFGFLAGYSNSNSLLRNFSFDLEYTRILPWVYSNWIPAQTYSNLGYLMGHYIGQNADQFYTNLSYEFKHFKFSLNGDYTRQGGFSDVVNQYTSPGEPFLYGPKRKILRLGFGVDFKYLENIFIKFNYSFFNVSDEDQSRTPDWQKGKNHLISLRLFYGLDR